jgi:hypothetical protein
MICGVDAGARSVARASFRGEQVYVIEASPQELAQALKAFRADVLVLLGETADYPDPTLDTAVAHTPLLVRIVDPRQSISAVDGLPDYRVLPA